MRAYFFGNMYLSSIQQGIQAAHALAEIYEAVRGKRELGLQVKEWATNHKTMILLNAGYGENLHALVDRFTSPQNTYPWAPLFAEQAALDGAITSVGIILPGIIYNGASAIRLTSMEEVECGTYQNSKLLPEGLQPDFWKRLTEWEQELVLDLNNYRLAS